MGIETSQALDQAVALLQHGQRVEGETLLVRAVEAAGNGRWFGLLGRRGREDTSPASPAHAAALFDLSRYLVACGDPERAIAPVKLASAIVPTDQQTRRDRLTYGMNLGETLQLAGHLDEAETVLRANLEERRSFYGDGSEGVAWGLEPLASLLLARGRLEEARVAANQALDILWTARSPHVAAVLPLVGAVAAALAIDPPLVPRFDALPPDLKIQTLDAAVQRARTLRDLPALRVADELVARCARLPGAEARVSAARANVFRLARSLGAHEIAVSAARTLVEDRETAGDSRGAAEAMDALALELADAGRIDEARAAFGESARRARDQGDPILLAHTLRNFGLVLADLDEPAWRETLEEALASAEAGAAPGNRDEVARASGALGIRLQHTGEIDRARELLARAVTLGEQVFGPADPDMFALRTHLEAVRAGKLCGCSPDGTIEQRHAIEAEVLVLVQRSVPAGLVDRVTMGDDGQWSVNATRQLESEDEAMLLVRALEQALAQIRAKVRD